MLDERSEKDFLTYANSVIKSRAVPFAEDNLKPIHRKILYTLWEDKLTPDKKTKKCATVVGHAMTYSPHGDSSIYGALVRLSQWWKLRYPLIEMQGNCGNILGDGAAASRYTECKLSEVGQLMLEELKDKRCVDFKPNYDETTEEPVTLPSRFPFLLCGNNSGIAVGLASDFVSHNYNEAADAITYCIDNPDCSIADLMKYMPGPDFPAGGQILNGEDLLEIYTTGKGGIKMRAHYDITKNGKQTIVTFHDLPYGVEIDSNIKAPLKKLVLDDGYTVFENIDTVKTSPRSFDVIVTLGKDANINECMNLLWSKTGLEHTVKVNQMLIVNGKPQVLNLKQLIEFWVNYRSNIIKRLAYSDLLKQNKKLTIILGLKKCMTNIDRVIEIVRFDAAPKLTLMKEFELNDEQATAVLDLKLAKLSKLEIAKLNDDETDLEKEIADLKEKYENVNVRLDMIKKDLIAMKKIIGKDERRTEILYNKPIESLESTQINKEYQIYTDGLHINNYDNSKMENNLVDVVFASSATQIMAYNKDGEMGPAINFNNNLIGGFVLNNEDDKIIAVTKNGNIKLSLKSDYKLSKTGERIMKIKEDDELIFAASCNNNQYLMLLDDADHILKLDIKTLPIASKLTVGVKSGFANILSASVVKDSDNLLFVDKNNKGKLTPVKDFSVDSRGNKGQQVVENTMTMRNFSNARENIYGIPKTGAISIISRNKVSIKSRTATGASLGAKNFIKFL